MSEYGNAEVWLDEVGVAPHTIRLV